MTEPESENQHRPADGPEPETYELDLDDSAQAPAAPPSKPASKSGPSPRSAPQAGSPAPGGKDEADLYDLAEPEALPRPAPPKTPIKPDPRLDTTAVPSAPPATGTSAPKTQAEAEGKAVPKQYQTEPEPAYLDPAVAASKREQARIRAAEQLAAEEAKRRKTRLTILAICLALAILVGLWWWLAS